MAALKILILAAAAGLCAANPASESFNCVQEGRFQNPLDCAAYVTCEKAQNGTGFVEQHRARCHDTQAFSTRDSNCVDLDQVADCSPSSRSPRHSDVGTIDQGGRLPHLDHLCTTALSANGGLKCGDCKQLINCANEMAYLAQFCDADKVCEETGAPTEFQSTGFCMAPTSTTECKCTASATGTGQQQWADPHNSNKGFYTCESATAVPQVSHCPDHTVLTFVTNADQNIAVCTGENDYPVCYREGALPIPGDCTKYTWCAYSEDGYVMTQKTCPNGVGTQWINVLNNECENACDWVYPVTSFKCGDATQSTNTDGYYADPHNCRKYYRCYSSDGGTTWETTHLTCNHAHIFYKDAATPFTGCKPEATHACVQKERFDSLCGKPTSC